MQGHRRLKRVGEMDSLTPSRIQARQPYVAVVVGVEDAEIVSTLCRKTVILLESSLPKTSAIRTVEGGVVVGTAVEEDEEMTTREEAVEEEATITIEIITTSEEVAMGTITKATGVAVEEALMDEVATEVVIKKHSERTTPRQRVLHKI